MQKAQLQFYVMGYKLNKGYDVAQNVKKLKTILIFYY